MTRREKLEACARAICALYCPYEMSDQDATPGDLFAETVLLLEANPSALLAWISEF